MSAPVRSGLAAGVMEPPSLTAEAVEQAGAHPTLAAEPEVGLNPLPERPGGHDLPGFLITFEGCEGTGKSTQIALAAEWLQNRSIPLLMTHEPGGTALGQSLRTLLLGENETGCSAVVELFLMLADRAHHVSEVIRPSLAEGLVVLCDRFNDSTMAYQAAAGGLDAEAVRDTCTLSAGGLSPDLTILLDMDPEDAFRRLERKLDRMEQKGAAYHRLVREAYLKLYRDEPHRFALVNADDDQDAVAGQIRAAIAQVLSLPGAAA